MLKKSHACSIVLLLLVMFMSSAAWAATITGSVTNGTGRTGRIHVVAELVRDGSRSFGTSIPTTGGPFTISGVIPGAYVVHAFLDTQGTAIQHANDPQGASAELTVGPNASTVPAGIITLATPPAVAVRAPEGTVYGGSGGNYVKWSVTGDPPGLPTADYYIVRWSGVQTGQSERIRSGFEDSYFHRGGVPSLSYTITAYVDESSLSSPPITVVTPPPSGVRITGRVSFPDAATGPLIVAAINEAVNPPVIRVAAIGNPTTPASYTLNNVPAGNYDIVAFLDQNNSGTFDVGDAGMVDTNDFQPHATVATAEVTVPVITLEGGSAATIISTGHGKSRTAEWFNLVVTAQSMRKQLVGATMTGPQLEQEVTLGLRKSGDFHTRIPMGRQSPGDRYQLVLNFADGTSETVNEDVTAVLTGFATPIAPVGNIIYNARPTFRWSAPSPVPTADYLYSIWLTNAETGESAWTTWGLPSGTTTASIPQTTPALEDGTTYKWILNVTDANGNMAAREVEFTPTSSAAVSGFSPAGGPAGTVVTITGVNFPTSPAPTVLFGTTPATVTAATNSTTITATVPVGAATGKITVNELPQTVNTFYVGQPVTVTGRVLNSAGAPFQNAKVDVIVASADPDSTTPSTTTDATGNFTLESVFPGQTVTLWITPPTTATEYVSTYSAALPIDNDNRFLTGQELDLTPYPFHLYTQEQLETWGVTAGRGMISGRVMTVGLEPYAPVSGATVAITPSFPVSYYNGTTVTGTSTAANGTFMVFDVPEQWIQAEGQKTGWTFYTGNFEVRAGSVTEGFVFGSTAQPTITSFTPTRGKRGSTVTITGVNFSPEPSENVITFGTVAATNVTAGPEANQLTVTVPSDAVTSDLSITARGVTTTLSNQPFTVMHTLTASVAGAGTVNSIPSGIACAGTTGCTADFARGSSVTLTASPSAGSTFSGWSGACTGSGNCQVVMNSDLNAAAIFTSSNAIRIGSTYYGTLASAIAAAPPGSRIEMQAGAFPVSTLTVGKNVRIDGGYNSSFTARTGFTTLFGTLLVDDGALRVDRITVR